MRTWSFALVLGALLVLNSACSVQGDITDLSIRNKLLNSAPTLGFTSGSQNVTVDGYQVSASVGSYHSGMKAEVDGYTVYTSLQGQLTSDVETVTVE